MLYNREKEFKQLENFLISKYKIAGRKKQIEKMLIGKHYHNEAVKIIEAGNLDLTHFVTCLNYETKIIEGINYFIEAFAYELHQIVISDSKHKDVYQWNDDLNTPPGELEKWTHLNTGRILTVFELYEIYFIADEAGLNIEFIQP